MFMTLATSARTDLSCLCYQVPEGVDWAAVVKNAMDKYNVEIAGGLGPTAGKVWRVGIMVQYAPPLMSATFTLNLLLLSVTSFSNQRQQGKVSTIPVQGYNAKLENVELVIAAFKDGLKQQEFLQ